MLLYQRQPPQRNCQIVNFSLTSANVRQATVRSKPVVAVLVIQGLFTNPTYSEGFHIVKKIK
jgi:hypothetical protein